MINIIDSVLIPPLDLITTVTEADLTGFLALIAVTPSDPRLIEAISEMSDWTLYVFHNIITLIFIEIRLILSIAFSQILLSFNI